MFNIKLDCAQSYCTKANFIFWSNVQSMDIFTCGRSGHRHVQVFYQTQVVTLGFIHEDDLLAVTLTLTHTHTHSHTLTSMPSADTQITVKVSIYWSHSFYHCF